MLPEDARRHHRAMILQVLFREGPASRADLARSTGLTRVTVSDVVARLVEEGLVTEMGAREGTRVGKPATLVALAVDAFNIVMLDLSPDDEILGAISNLAGRIVVRRAVALKGAKGADALAIVLRLAQALIEECRLPVLGVGVASPGIVDISGTVLDAPNLAWTDVPLAALATERLGVPVHVANDANTAAMGELAYGDAAVDGLLVLRVGHGVGAGVVVDGHLVRGTRGAAGEIGHVVVEADGQLCACGRRGCLETLLATRALRAAVGRRPETERQAVLAALGTTLGGVLAPITAALNLREVVLSGPTDLLGGAFAEAATRVIRERTMPVIAADLQVRISSLGEDAVLVGAAGLVLSAELGVS